MTSAADLKLLPGVSRAIARLNLAGMRVVVISNQRGVALGMMSEEGVDAIHAQISKRLKAYRAHIDGFYFCPHEKESCSCRKPLPGLFLQAASDFPEIHPETSVMIGDSLSDIEFGRNLGMPTIWIRGNSEHRKKGWELAADQANLTCDSLAEAVDAILNSAQMRK